MSLSNLIQYPRLELIGAPTPLEHLPRLSDYLGRDIFIKRDDITPLALGGNKLRKLEFLAADALREGADVLITAGAIQSNHVRQTAAVAAEAGTEMRRAAGKPHRHPCGKLPRQRQPPAAGSARLAKLSGLMHCTRPLNS